MSGIEGNLAAQLSERFEMTGGPAATGGPCHCREAARGAADESQLSRVGPADATCP
jgi:hypothetical protein